MEEIAIDTECYKNFYYFGCKRFSDGKRVGVEMSPRTGIWNGRRVKSILLQNLCYGFNLIGYDNPMLFYALQLTEDPLADVEEVCAKLKAMSDSIIKGGVRPWQAAEHAGVIIPSQYKFIDLMEPQPNAKASLKTLNGRMHGKRLQDLPFDPDTILTHGQMDVVADYCLTSDLDATHNLRNDLTDPIELRRVLSAEHGQDFMCKSDSQIGEAIVQSQARKKLGRRVVKPKTVSAKPFKYHVPDFFEFETPAIREVVDRLRTEYFKTDKDGKIVLPKWLEDAKIELGGMVYQMGIGGLHSTESNRAVHSDATHVLVDADVAAQYPSIIDKLGLYPEAIGPVFCEIYRGIIHQRFDVKQKLKALKAELETLKGANDPDRQARAGQIKAEMKYLKAVDKGLKIVLNGVYGKLGSRYSILYAPHLLLAVTLTGQLSLLMLAEMALKRGVGVESGNTDGVVFRCPRDMYAGVDSASDRLFPSELADICAEWEARTGFKLEFVEYRSIYNRDVNNYFAIKADGGHKRKGVFGNWWSKHPDDDDGGRMKLMKNPTATICSDAALAFMKDGTPIENTIRDCVDFTQFVTIRASKTGATWRDEYLGKTVRFYWGLDGAPIKTAGANAKGTFNTVAKSEGCIPAMTLPDEFPDDVDYARYIQETRDHLIACGAIEKPFTVADVVRITNKNRAPAMLGWIAAL